MFDFKYKIGINVVAKLMIIGKLLVLNVKIYFNLSLFQRSLLACDSKIVITQKLIFDIIKSIRLK